MDCVDARRQLEALVDGELEEAAAARVRAHLAGCAACAAEHRAAVTLPLRMTALPGPGAVDLVPAVMARVGRGRVSRPASAALFSVEAILACLTLVQLGTSGLLAAIAASLRDGSALLGGQTANPAAGDIVLVVTLLLLVAASTVHLVLITDGAPRGRTV